MGNNIEERKTLALKITNELLNFTNIIDKDSINLIVENTLINGILTGYKLKIEVNSFYGIYYFLLTHPNNGWSEKLKMKRWIKQYLESKGILIENIYICDKFIIH